MKTSEQINELSASLSLFQAGVGTLPKDASGYGYKYTTLDTVVEAIREPLSAAGFSFVQMPSTPPVEYGASVALTTRLMHASGQWLEDTLIIPIPEVGKSNQAQAYGAALTYARRYALTSMLGLVADEDIDASSQPKQPPTVTKKANVISTKPAVSDDQRKPTEPMRKKLWASGNALYGTDWDEQRATLVSAVTKGRTASSKQITFDECKKLIDGIEKKANE